MLVRKLGREKYKDFINNFDEIIDKYRQLADNFGYTNELKFKKEGKFMVIFVKLNDIYK